MFRLILSIAALCVMAESYKILIIFPGPSPSHANLGRGIVRALTNHIPDVEITYVAAYAEKNFNKNVKQIIVPSLDQIGANLNMESKPSLNEIKNFTRRISDATLNYQPVQETVIKDKYDAVITEWFFSDSYTGFSAVQQCPWIMFATTVIHPHLELLVDTMNSPAVLPLMITEDLPVPMNFFQRIKNTFIVFYMLLNDRILEHSSTVAEYEHYFKPLAEARGVPLPDFDSTFNNLSLLFVNSHPSTSYPMSLPPNTIEIAGFHIDEETLKLPKDLQIFLDNAKEGVVYFSLGSVVKSSKLPLEVRNQFLQVLGELPYTVLWKFEEELENLPKNVHIMKWVPQQSVLAHPNVKLFITHSGQLSTTEAVHFGVPLLAIPVFGDQPRNADNAVRNGFGLKVPFTIETDMSSDLRAALKELLNNKKYYNRAKELSKIFKARIASPSKTIAFYTQLVIESKGALHLRPTALLYPFYQRLLLDQLAFILAIFTVLYCAIKKIFNLLFKDTKKGKKVKKN